MSISRLPLSPALVAALLMQPSLGRKDYDSVKSAVITKKEIRFQKNRNRKKRKGRDRNKMCPCGSNQKFKHCCWSK